MILTLKIHIFVPCFHLLYSFPHITQIFINLSAPARPYLFCVCSVCIYCLSIFMSPMLSNQNITDTQFMVIYYLHFSFHHFSAKTFLKLGEGEFWRGEIVKWIFIMSLRIDFVFVVVVFIFVVISTFVILFLFEEGTLSKIFAFLEALIPRSVC